MRIYLSRPQKYMPLLKELNWDTFAIFESDLKKFADNSLEAYISRHVSKPYTTKVFYYKENGKVEFNGQELDVIEYPDLEVNVKAKALVIRYGPDVKLVDKKVRRNVIDWLKGVLKVTNQYEIFAHLAQQTTPNLAIELAPFGLDSFDIDMNRFAVAKRVLLPGGEVKNVGGRGVAPKVIAWARTLKCKSSLVNQGNYTELIKFNLASLQYYFKHFGKKIEDPVATEEQVDNVNQKSSYVNPGANSGGEFMQIQLKEEDLPESIRNLESAMEQKDDTKIIQGLAALLKEEVLRYYQGRETEKNLGGLNSELTKISQNIFSRSIEILKFIKPELAGDVNNYINDNRKIIIGSVVSELGNASPETRKQLAEMVKELRADSNRRGTRRNRVVVGEPALSGEASSNS